MYLPDRATKVNKLLDFQYSHRMLKNMNETNYLLNQGYAKYDRGPGTKLITVSIGPRN